MSRKVIIPPLSDETRVWITKNRHFEYDQSVLVEANILDQREDLYAAIADGDSARVKEIQRRNRSYLGIGW